ncbi:MAG: UDP-N-acetylmuramate dehydrogenase [Betaproteobacteria bacterium]|nr:UDP-N-acetylmuramate dehydrogenase [Betaproteobacteria bacterium]
MSAAASAMVSSASQLRGRMIADADMSRHCSWRAGGLAELLYVAADLEDACEFLAGGDYPQPLTMVGLGSNFLVRDGGLRGTLLKLAPAAGQIERLSEQRLRVQAGAACPKLARQAVAAGLAGCEFLAGIPGSIGGALAMNAGCYGSTTWQRVVSVTTLSEAGVLEKLSPESFAIGYRTVARRDGQPLMFASAEFEFDADEDGQARQRMEEMLAKRSRSQPIGTANAGSVFTNPPGSSAGRLLDEVGMRGASFGGARVSRRHANFIINEKNATAADIETLIGMMQEAVFERCDIRLYPEVRIVGDEA